MAGTVQGDYVAAGSIITITGTVNQDALLAAGTIIENGVVNGDIRAAAGNIMVDGPVGGDLVVGAGTLNLGPKTVIQGDLITGAGQVIIDPAARIMGQKIIKTDDGKGKKAMDDAVAEVNVTGRVISLIIGILGMMVVAAIFFGLFPKFTSEVTVTAVDAKSFWKSLGLGVLILIVTPIAGFIALFTGIGSLLGAIILFTYFIYLFIAIAFAGLLAGHLLKKILDPKAKEPLCWLSISGGIVLLALIGIIPIIGPLVGFVLTICAMGAILQIDYKRLKM
jgi:cytoskeletal protein CcmA (bactofilin family)